VVEWWSGGVVEWWSGGVVEWWSGGVVEWWSGGVEVYDRKAIGCTSMLSGMKLRSCASRYTLSSTTARSTVLSARTEIILQW
jgi:hypothetical protein